MKTESVDALLERITYLEHRLAESEQLIDAIRAGEVDAFAVNENNKSEIYTLQSGDYAYRLLIEQFGEGAINITEDGLIVYTNTYFVDLLQTDYEKVIGSFLTDFIHMDSLQKFQSLFDQALTDKSKGEINLVVNNKIIPVYISLTSLQPRLATVGIIITDLSEKKKNEEVIFNYQKELEGKNNALAQSNIELDSFSYIASHDLQEPLRKIQTYCNRIQDNEFETFTQETKEHFQRIVGAAARMQNLINSLLNYSRMNSTVIVYEATDLNVIVQEVLKNLSHLIDENHVVTRCEKLPVIDAFPDQMTQLFTNLVSNSIKYRHRDVAPEIYITVSSAPASSVLKSQDAPFPDYWKISVADNGIGFEPQYAEKIFELFQRLHSKFEYEGTGLGLAICRKIAQNHHGFIKADGKPGDGATFELYLPKKKSI
jgi:PAS domain S-box-containing protein